MEYNKNNNTVTLGIQEYSKLINDLELINNKINELQKIILSHGNKIIKTESNNCLVESDIKIELKKMYETKLITYKQYKVLKYILENQYFSDAEVSKSTSVSYSSISQWKKKDLKFKNMYNKILLFKTV